MKKICKILSLSLLTMTPFTGIIGLSSCSGDSAKDSDFDGLNDRIDPNPKSNQYDVRLYLDEQSLSNSIPITIDYRDFIKEGYNTNLSLLCALFCNEVDSLYGTFGSKPVFTNDVYDPSLLTAFPIYGQIGGENIEYKMLEDYTIDKYDTAALCLSHHTFIDETEQVHQFFFVTIDGYVNGLEQWISNFDLGAWDDDKITEGYKEFWNVEDHEWWKDHSCHKGFDVTARRCKKAIDEYVEKHQKSDAHRVMIITGQSRAGALTNLIGKMYSDDNVDNRCYSFNPPAVTKSKTLGEYKTLFVLNNTNDLVSRVPCPKYWEFKRYGNIYDINVEETGKDIYYNFFNQTYLGNSDEFLDVIEAQLADLSLFDPPSSENIDPFNSNGIYEKWHHPDMLGIYDYELFETETECNNFMQFIDDHCNDLVEAIKISPQPGKTTWRVEWKNKGALFIRFLDEMLTGKLTEDDEIKYMSLLNRFISETIEQILETVSLSYLLDIKDRIMKPHEQKTACVLAMCVKPD